VDALANAIRRLYMDANLRARMGAWGRLYVENEWSPEAAYYHLFLAWRELGLLEKWGMGPKINFHGQPEPTSKPTTITPRDLVSLHEFRMGDEEGPYAHLGLGRFRWALGPKSEFLIHSPAPGKVTLILRYRNLLEGQKMTVEVNGQTVLDLPLAVTGIEVGKLACAGAELKSGYNRVHLVFAKWKSDPNDPRPLAAAITEISCLPDLVD
jgi:hypothetical protein